MPITYTISENKPTRPTDVLVRTFEHSYQLAGGEVCKQTLYQFEYAHGMVVGEFERNGYDDSDFFAIVFNPELNIESAIPYASTRYSSLGCHATIDASDEVKAAWMAFRKEREERVRAERLESIRKETEEQKAKMLAAGVSELAADRFAERSSRWSKDYREACLVLLKTKNFRSSFRKSLRDQIVGWLEDSSPTYQTPLSDRQIARVA